MSHILLKSTNAQGRLHTFSPIHLKLFCQVCFKIFNSSSECLKALEPHGLGVQGTKLQGQGNHRQTMDVLKKLWQVQNAAPRLNTWLLTTNSAQALTNSTKDWAFPRSIQIQTLQNLVHYIAKLFILNKLRLCFALIYVAQIQYPPIRTQLEQVLQLRQ